MVNLLYAEILKLKRSNIFFISIIGATVAPFMCFIAHLIERSKMPHIPIKFDEFFSYTNLYVTLLIGVLLYGVVTAYVFNREYVENTLKNLITIPVSKTRLLISKLILLFIWIIILTFTSWGITLIFGLIGQFQDLNGLILTNSFKEYIIGGSLLFLLTTPLIFVTLIFKDYVATIVLTIAITMVNVLISNSEYSALFPWSATLIVARNNLKFPYPLSVSYISIFATSILGFIASIIYFKKVDIG